MVEALSCPICGSKPDVDETDLHNGWYAGCYKPSGPEHCVMASGRTREEAVRNYNADADEIRRDRQSEAAYMAGYGGNQSE